MTATQTNDGTKGGTLKGDAHSAPSGGIDAVVITDNNKPVKLEGGEAIINKEAVALHKETLSEINQSAGNGVPIMGTGGDISDSPRLFKPYINNSNYGKRIVLIKKRKDDYLGFFLDAAQNYHIGVYESEKVKERVKAGRWQLAKPHSATMQEHTVMNLFEVANNIIESEMGFYKKEKDQAISDRLKDSSLGPKGREEVIKMVDILLSDKKEFELGGNILQENNDYKPTHTMKLQPGTHITEGTRKYEITELLPTEIIFKEKSALMEHKPQSKSYDEIRSLCQGGSITIDGFDCSNPVYMDLLAAEIELIQARHQLADYKKKELDTVEKQRIAYEAEKKLNERKRRAKALHLQSETQDDEPEEMAQGGPVKNTYEGKTPAQVWTAWSGSQRAHFLHDHIFFLSKTQKSNMSTATYKQLPEKVKKEVAEHISMPRYGKGKMVKPDQDGYDKAHEKMYNELMDSHTSIKEFNKKYDKWIKENAPKYGIEYKQGGLVRYGKGKMVSKSIPDQVQEYISNWKSHQPRYIVEYDNGYATVSDYDRALLTAKKEGSAVIVDVKTMKTTNVYKGEIMDKARKK